MASITACVLNEGMPTTRSAAAEFALKSYIAEGMPEITLEAPKLMGERQDAVSLTEAPEDAVCSLVVDLMHYCEHERIDWAEDVLSRARQRFATERNIRLRR